MKRKKENYLIKGVYGRPQVSGFLALRQYMLIERDGKHCLLLKFENEFYLPITEASFTVQQLDKNGQSLGSVDIRYSDILIESGETYCAPRGIVVDHDCVDCIVQVREILCGKLKYALKNGEITGHYDKRGYAKKRRTAVMASPSEIKRRYSGGGKFYGLIALISLLLVLCSLFFVKAQADKLEEKSSLRASHTSTYVP